MAELDALDQVDRALEEAGADWLANDVWRIVDIATSPAVSAGRERAYASAFERLNYRDNAERLARILGRAGLIEEFLDVITQVNECRPIPLIGQQG